MDSVANQRQSSHVHGTNILGKEKQIINTVKYVYGLPDLDACYGKNEVGRKGGQKVGDLSCSYKQGEQERLP